MPLENSHDRKSWSWIWEETLGPPPAQASVHTTRNVVKTITLPPLWGFPYLGLILERRRREDFNLQQKTLAFLVPFLLTRPFHSISLAHKSSSSLLDLASLPACCTLYLHLYVYPAGRAVVAFALWLIDGHILPGCVSLLGISPLMVTPSLPSLASLNIVYATTGKGYQ